MRLSLGQKFFGYTGGVLVLLLLATLLVLERTQSRQWEEHFLVQSEAFARLATPELIKRFRGDFSAQERPLGADAVRFLAFNRDLVDFSFHTPSGRLLYRSPRLPDFVDLDLTATTVRRPVQPEGTGIYAAEILTLADGARVLELSVPAYGPTGETVLLANYLLAFDSVDHRIREVRHRFLSVAGISLGCALVLAAWVGRRLTRPIRALTEGVHFIARGELATRIQETGGDELGRLGRAFNEMAESLSHSRDALTRKNQELSRVNADLWHMQEQLVRSERMAAIGQLAAGVSHEIDNPVGIILGYAELLLEDTPVDDPRRDDLRAIIDECKRCRRITGGLLGFARGTPHRFECVRIDELVEGTLEALRPQKIFKGVALQLRQRQDFPPLWADSDHLRQVLVNLLLNAAQAMGGTGTVHVVLDCAPAGYIISVEDSGPGIPEPLRDKIFEPFFTSKSGGEGTGLGLSISRRLIEDQGGRITVGDAALGGAAFRIEMPATLAEKCFDNESFDSLG